ncbi:MAG: nitrate reductase [Chloroflexi bacterium]|nr:nitrate reductase [Chloroflexota bacterium]
MPGQTATTICPYCGVGCGLRVDVAGGRVVRVRGDDAHPGTQGKLCRKAVYLPHAVYGEGRLEYPLMRETRDAVRRETTWDDALGRAAAQLQLIIDEHGPDSVAFYVSGQLLTEDYYVVNKLAKGFLGTNNLDSNSRLCMASAVVAYQLALGQDGPPCAYADIDEADCFLFVGSNAADCHPVLFQRALARKAARPNDVSVIVVDPRRTPTARAADIHLQLQPGTDVPLLLCMLNILICEQLVDREFIDTHTNGWQTVAEAAAEWPVERAARVTGVPAELILRAARAFGQAPASLSFWAMGVNQATDGVDRSLALINLHLATGQIGRPGAGPFSLTGQPNAMGGREVGGLAALLPGYRMVNDAQHRQEMADLWDIPVDRLNPKPGLTGVEMFEALADGRLKAIWIAGTNPAASMPSLETVRRGLERAELVVVQDAYFPTETALLADIVLPAAQWAEKEGTTTSSERRVSYMPRLVAPPGLARPDWLIFAELAQLLGYTAGDFDFGTAEDVFDEFRRCTAGTSVDITGLSYARLRNEGGVQWPCPVRAASGVARLYTDHHFSTPDGRARFHRPTWREPVAAEGRWVLNTGRERDQWHTMTRTGRVPQLLKSCPEPYIGIHPDDAQLLQLSEGDSLEVLGDARGRARFNTRITADVLPGTVYVPFHWGTLRYSGGSVNESTTSELDPRSKQPALKLTRVHIRRVA